MNNMLELSLTNNSQYNAKKSYYKLIEKPAYSNKLKHQLHINVTRSLTDLTDFA